MGETDRQGRQRERDGNSLVTAQRRRKHISSSSSSKPSSSHKPAATPSGNLVSDDKPVTIDELRKIRLDYHNKSAQEKRKSEMKYVYEPRVSRKVQGSTKESTAKKHKATDGSRRHHHGKEGRTAQGTGDSTEYVYRHATDDLDKAPTVEIDDVTTKASTNISKGSKARKDSGSIHRSRPSQSRSRATSSQKASIRGRRSSQRLRSEASKNRPAHKHLDVVDEDSPRAVRDSRERSAHEPLTERPTLQRSATSVRLKADAATPKRSVPVRSNADPRAKDDKKTPGLFASLFGAPSPPQGPEKKITCLACLADDIPISKSAKLACSHRMCHDCLKRIFKLSITDPAHMPPKCCTNDHIPLKHVEKLFDMKFKIKWNRKYQEYMTRNRIYCPARRCGEWIKPSHITTENGRKIGTCKRCHTRVCCLCNNKMHKSRECPKDEATKQFIETAQKEGWQRCFNCKAMVELKEGCNHMTCRCTAEFCMICGAKWKTCDCPWFNYNAVEADRLLHMNIPEARRAYAHGQGRAPLRLQEEIDRRREQERRDESLARRMQAWGLNEEPTEVPGHIDILGIGNAGDHFLNQNFVQAARNVLAGDFRGARRAADALLNGTVTGRENPLPPAPFEFPPAVAAETAPGIRRHHTTTTRAYNVAPTTRPSERVVPGRRTSDYFAEAARHQPLHDLAALPTQRPSLSRRNTARAASSEDNSGLFGRPDPSGRETDRRIENWRSSIIPGAEA